MSPSPDEPGTPESSPEPPAELCERLRGGDPVAASDAAAAFLDPLAADLRVFAPHADDHTVLTAAGDAVLSLIRNPAGYNPALGTLAGYLRMAARRDLLERERRHHRGREPGVSVEDAPDARNPSRDTGADLPSFDAPDLAAVAAAFDEPERQAFELMRAGERRTEAFAAALGLGHLSPAEQATGVKRVKDRIVKRFRRARGLT